MRLIFLCLLFPFSIQAQPDISYPIHLDPNASNFEKAMAFTEPTGKHIDTLVQLCFEYSFANKDSCILLGDKAVELSKHISDKSYLGKALLELGDSHRKFGKSDKGQALLIEGKEIYKQLDNMGQVANADNKLGVLFVGKGENEKAINHFISALKSWEITKDSQYMFKPYLNISMIYYRLGQFEKCTQYTDEAWKWAELMDNDRARMHVFNNKAILAKQQANTYNESDSTDIRYEILKDSARIFYDIAFQNLGKSAEIAKLRGDKPALVNALMNMVELKIALEDYHEARILGKEIEPLALGLGNTRSIIHNKTIMLRSNYKLNFIDKAIKYGEEIIVLSRKNNMVKEQSLANNILHKAYQKKGDYIKAYNSFRDYTNYELGASGLNANIAIAEAEGKYQTAIKENKILELKAQNKKIKLQKNSILGGLFLLGILGFFGFRFRKIQKEKNDKKAFVEALIYAQEEERKRIAQDLHDGVGQSLLLIKKQMATTQQITLDNQTLISDTLEEVRMISRDLHPFQLEKFGITSSIKDMLSKVENITNIFVSHELENIDNILDSRAELNVFRAIQEALNNIIKHSEATAAKITVSNSDSLINIRIQDNGKGYDLETVKGKSKSLGLRTMNERIEVVGGNLKVESGSPSGTIISIKIPTSK